MKTLIMAFAAWLMLSTVAFAAVNINTANKDELVSLKGIGEKRAQEIIDYRKKHGNFKTVDDLEKVPGIGPGLMKQIRSELTVTGKTTAPASSKSKGEQAKKADAPKGDAMKADTAKAKVAEKSKAEEKKAEKK